MHKGGRCITKHQSYNFRYDTKSKKMVKPILDIMTQVLFIKIKQREKERELGVPKIQNICEQDAKIVRRNERFPLDLIIKSHKPTKQLLVLGALALLSKF